MQTPNTDDEKPKRTRKPGADATFQDGQDAGTKKKAAAKGAKKKADAKHEKAAGAKLKARKEPGESKSVTAGYDYEKVVVETADGKKRHTADNADRLAQAMRGMDLKDVLRDAKKAGVDVAALSHLNPGMQRMNVGNRLRKIVKGGTSIEVNGKRIASL